MLRNLWEHWKVAAHKFGNFQARLILSIFYFVILSPFALGVKLFSDPLRIKRQKVAQWLPRDKETRSLTEGARRQF